MNCLFERIPLSVEFLFLRSHECGLLPEGNAIVSPSSGARGVGSATCYYLERRAFRLEKACRAKRLEVQIVG